MALGYYEWRRTSWRKDNDKSRSDYETYLFELAETARKANQKSYTVRLNAEYSMSVYAVDEASAVSEAVKTEITDWDQVAWSEPEAEEE